MSFLVFKSLHIIFVVTWFAGLFYTFRLFVYHAEAEKFENVKREILRDQYLIMEKRLWYIITWPSAILTLILGTALLIENPTFLQAPYMLIKLTFVLFLILYQFYGQKVLNNLAKGQISLSSQQFRLLNEIPTVILIAVVFLIVMKDEVNWIYSTLSILGISILLMLAVKWYKRRREE